MSNQVVVIRAVEATKMGAAAPAKFPLGDIIAMQSTAQAHDVIESDAMIGVWESTPGRFERFLPNREFSYIVQGWCVFEPEGLDPVELHAGDAVLFPADCKGIWDIKENFKKTYCLF
ncbi:cupin domain-containing protein [Paenalcaligenes sp. Me131]|uniref:cupin domain-containing protein n=1 Tax=Paenalcaligenes sp. Me131 TaxID=3392636 RepID=UPI003D279402